MIVASLILPLLSLAIPTASEPGPPLVCNVGALTAAQRARHRTLGEKLLGAVVRKAELPNGYELVFDLSRISDAQGRQYRVVEVAEWVDLESRCCPFLDFRIDVVGKGAAVELRLTGPRNVKEFLRAEIPILAERE